MPANMAVTGTDLPARGSLRSRGAAAISGVTLRQLSAVLPPERAWGLWASRRIVAQIMNSFGPSLAGTRIEPVDVRMADGRRVVGEWVRGPGVDTGDRAIYFVHGSGFALCSPRTHRRLTAWLSRLTGLPVFCVDYRLAPAYRFPTAADDVRSGWDWLCSERGLAPDRIFIAGDSAGGHLAVDLLLQNDIEHPAGLALLSPLIDLTFALARTREYLRRDPAIRAADAARLVRLYCAGTDLDHPRLTLDVAGGRRMPPTLIQAGGGEMLVADARRLAADVTAAGGRCELQVWPDQVHVFQALPRLTPEAAPAMRHVAAFIADSMHQHDAERVAG
ncbi:alpha/beta hydrolase [Mycolicibacterium sp. YH-1]|uniref:alpha/beta hydrolase n=1 Tax=Mycolicibacterium sp. YH-1 TaxID=2908837 RepID=UPI001F4C045A|nr:alpha/beta hydrolase [Mycolicibacterium sp. YH-1]UNB51230.1 alpha/beta hydrolase [Mycolicibacterium sp. YH-1]